MKLFFSILLASVAAGWSAAPVAPFVGQYEVARRDHFLIVSNLAVGNSPTGGVSAAAAGLIATNAMAGKANTNAAVVQNFQLNGESKIGNTDFKLVYDADGNAGMGRSSSTFFLEFFDLDSTVSIGNGGGTTNRGDLIVSGDVSATAYTGSGANLSGLTNALHKAETNAPSLYTPKLYADIDYRALVGNVLSYTFRADENSLLDTHIVSLARNEWVDGATSQGIIGYHRYGSGDIGISLRPQGAGSVTNTGNLYNLGALFFGSTNIMDLIAGIVSGAQDTNNLAAFHAGAITATSMSAQTITSTSNTTAILTLSNFPIASVSATNLNCAAYSRFTLTNLLAHNITLSVSNFSANDEITIVGQGAASGGTDYTVTIVDVSGDTVRWADGCPTNGLTTITATNAQSFEFSLSKASVNTSNIVRGVYGRFK